MNFDELYDLSYAKKQLSKFEKRYENHWGLRINEVFKITDSLNNSKSSKVLDLGCSIGTYAFEFCKRGYTQVAP